MQELRIACFKADVTPPLGAQMAYDINEEQDTPIYARGVVLDDGHMRVVIVACDFINIWGRSWFEWRVAVADAASTAENRVFLHCVHQHDSMRISPQWNEYAETVGRVAVDESYCREALASLRRAVADAVGGAWTPVARVMTAERRLAGLASNRRLVDGEGKCTAMRFSMCKNPDLRAWPVGLIDPLLRTVAFARTDGGVIAALHFYASHPMAAYGRKKVSQDVPGVALEHIGRECGEGTFNLYLSGCGGNITFGKYFMGDKGQSLQALGRRLGEGMVANLRQLEEKPLGPLRVTSATLDFPLDPAITEEAMQEQIRNSREGSPGWRAIARLIILRNWDQWRYCPLYRLSVGDAVHFLSLPAEMCVEYQLFAQSLVAEQFLACAAYGNGTYHYIPTARMFEEGGYEPKASIATPEIEPRLKAAITEVLRDP